MFTSCFCWSREEREKPRHCKIVLLDESHMIHEVQESTRGQDLLELVCRHLNLIETAYFGLRYVDPKGQARWLNLSKKLSAEVKGISMTLYFGVKLYPLDPCKLVEEITRYQVFLQLKQDILQSRLTVDTETAIELFAYSLQSELGDFDGSRHSPGYVSEFRFIPNQTREVEVKVAELHQRLAGQVPSAAEMAFLQKAKWLDLYGADLHPVLGEESSEYFIALTPNGILVLRNGVKVAEYFWPQIIKAERKGKYFLLKICQKNSEDKTYGFELLNDTACKHLLECVKDHKAFYSLTCESSPAFTTRSRVAQSTLPRKRSPPRVVRVPSRRYQRRIGQPDGADASGNKENLSDQGPRQGAQRKNSLPCHSTTDGQKEGPEAPIATQYDLWEQMSASMDVQGHSSDHGSHRHRHRSHSRSRHSDNESQVSRTSRCSRHSNSSRRSHNCRHNNERHNNERHNNEDHDSQCSSSSRKRKHRRKHRRAKSDSTEQMVDTKSQWQQIQQRQLKEIQVKSTVKSAHTHKTNQLVNLRGEPAPDQLYPDEDNVHVDHKLHSGRVATSSLLVDDELNGEHLYCNLPITQSAPSEAKSTKEENATCNQFNSPPNSFNSPVLSTLGSIGSRAPVCLEASELELALPGTKDHEMATEL